MARISALRAYASLLERSTAKGENELWAGQIVGRWLKGKGDKRCQFSVIGLQSQARLRGLITFFSKLLWLNQRRRNEEDLREEIQFHIEFTENPCNVNLATAY
jgi:hypothetical protein